MFADCSHTQSATANSPESVLLSAVTHELKQNPYRDLLEYSSVQPNEFFKDIKGNIVNRYQKPLSLYLQLLKMFALPGSVILDATCGTGSLELAALEKDAPANLEFISFDRNKYQIMNALNRLSRSCTKPQALEDLLVDVTDEQKRKKEEN